MSANNKIEKAMELRNSMVCPNCAETILMAYADELGMTEEQARNLGTNFGGGMKVGGVCGAITSAYIVMGGLGIKSPMIIGDFMRKMKGNHDGLVNCSDLLKANMEKGGEKKPHCDGMIKEAIELIESYREN